MTHFLSIQNTYDAVEVALFKNNEMLAMGTEDKLRASKYFFTLIETILDNQKLAFKDLSFLAVNQGPGPFTTLRVVIACVNGLNLATQIPLIGIDALDALLLEHADQNYPITIALLNAFNQDAYFGVQAHQKIKEKGYDNIIKLLDRIKKEYPTETVRFIGNGTELYKKEILAAFDSKAFISDPLPMTCSVKQIGLMGYEKWLKKENLTKELTPLYLKQTISPTP